MADAPTMAARRPAPPGAPLARAGPCVRRGGPVRRAPRTRPEGRGPRAFRAARTEPGLRRGRGRSAAVHGRSGRRPSGVGGARLEVEASGRGAAPFRPALVRGIRSRRRRRGIRATPWCGLNGAGGGRYGAKVQTARPRRPPCSSPRAAGSSYSSGPRARARRPPCPRRLQENRPRDRGPPARGRLDCDRRRAAEGKPAARSRPAGTAAPPMQPPSAPFATNRLAACAVESARRPQAGRQPPGRTSGGGGMAMQGAGGGGPSKIAPSPAAGGGPSSKRGAAAAAWPCRAACPTPCAARRAAGGQAAGGRRRADGSFCARCTSCRGAAPATGNASGQACRPQCTRRVRGRAVQVPLDLPRAGQAPEALLAGAGRREQQHCSRQRRLGEPPPRSGRPSSAPAELGGGPVLRHAGLRTGGTGGRRGSAGALRACRRRSPSARRP